MNIKNSIFFMPTVLIVFLISSFTVFAQDEKQDNPQNENETPKYEIGIHYSNFSFGAFDPKLTKEFGKLIRLDEVGTPLINQESNKNEPGIGARFTYNINKNIAIEGEGNFFYQYRKEIRPFSQGRASYQGGQKVQVLAGPKIGYRSKKFGVFGKVRPGIITFAGYPVIQFLEVSAPGSAFFGQGRQRATFFNVDVGGVVEYYPSRKSVIRFDIGDTIVRYKGQEPKYANPSFTRHNLQMNVGFGFRF